jgi:hypothetical protein
MNRLDFALAPFLRLNWVSDHARSVYEPRIEKIVQAWSGLEWLTVAHGLRRCGIATLTPERYISATGEWIRHGLYAVPIDILNQASGGGALRVVVGRPSDLAEFQNALEQGDDEVVAELLGTPNCCRDFLSRLYCDEVRDVVWPVAEATATREQDEATISLPCNPYTNILWNAVGIRAIPHVPCSFYCEPSFRLANRFIDIGKESGLQTEMEWLHEILTWPMEWSALHGIAETKSPVLRFISATDATSTKYTVRYLGTGFPAEAAQGLCFPYVVPARPKFTQTKNFLRGLAHPITLHTTTLNRTKGELNDSPTPV